MLMAGRTSSTWKHNRSKHNLKQLSTIYRPLRTHDTEIVSTNVCISRHCKSGQLDEARKLFDQMPSRTVVSWNAMVSGYSKWGRYSETLSLVSTMHHSNVRLNETTFTTTLSACARSGGLLSEGRQVHCLVLKSGMECFELLGSSMLYFYANCLKIEDAKRVFDELHCGNELLWSLMIVGYVHCNLMSDAEELFVKMPKRDVMVWTALISGFVKSEDGCERALELFKRMMRGSGEVAPNEFTLDCVIRACGRLGVLCVGMAVHGIVIKYGFESDESIGSTLIEFYCDCEAVKCAKRVYERRENLCLNVSNSLIGGLVLMGRIEDAERIFDRLEEKNSVSYNLMIKGYAMSGQVNESKRLFEKMKHRTIVSSNTMISVYSRNGDIDKALELFEEMKGERNHVTWNAMISGYIQNHQHEEALELYVTMHRLLIDRTRSTFSALLHACSCLGSLQLGQVLHAQLIKTPFESNVYVGTSLVDMYSKCGSITDAEASFICIYSPNVTAWTALVDGYAQYGLGCEAIMVFEQMLKRGVIPNAATFVGVLSACCRAGLVNEGMRIFNMMERSYGVNRTLEHYACLVDLLGRSGCLREAMEFIEQMPIEPDGVIWGALLNACWSWMDIELGEKVAEKMCSLDPNSASAFVILSNIYGVLGKWGAKTNVRKKLRSLEVKKEPGCSWIELNGKVHVFSVEDSTHPPCNLIYETLEHLIANINFIVQFDCVSLPIVDAGSINATYSH